MERTRASGWCKGASAALLGRMGLSRVFLAQDLADKCFHSMASTGHNYWGTLLCPHELRSCPKKTMGVLPDAYTRLKARSFSSSFGGIRQIKAAFNLLM